jgi:hypothetical protein
MARYIFHPAPNIKAAKITPPRIKQPWPMARKTGSTWHDSPINGAQIVILAGQSMAIYPCAIIAPLSQARYVTGNTC